MALSKEQRDRALTLIFDTMRVIEGIDEMKGTSFYSGNLKSSSTMFLNALKRIYKQNDQLYDVSPNLFTSITRDMDSMIRNMMNASATELALMNQIYERFKDKPEEFDKIYKIKNLNDEI